MQMTPSLGLNLYRPWAFENEKDLIGISAWLIAELRIAIRRLLFVVSFEVQTLQEGLAGTCH